MYDFSELFCVQTGLTNFSFKDHRRLQISFTEIKSDYWILCMQEYTYVVF
jgi:hypothetical protein